MTTPRDEQKRQLADLFERKTLEELEKVRRASGDHGVEPLPLDEATKVVVRASAEQLAESWATVGDMVDRFIPEHPPEGWLDALEARIDKALAAPAALPLEGLPPFERPSPVAPGLSRFWGFMPTRTPRVCCVCRQACPDNAPAGQRWSWGPDGMHVHFRCEREFARLHPELVPADFRPRDDDA